MATVCWQHTPGHYTTTTLPLYWDEAHANATVDSNDGYDSGPALTASANGAYVKKRVYDVGNPNEAEMFARVKVSTEPTVESILFGVTDADLNLLVCITRLPSGQVAAYKGHLEELLAVTADDDVDASATQLRLGFVAALKESGSIAIMLDDEVLAIANVGLLAEWAGVYVGCHQNIYISHVHACDDLVARPDWLCDVVFSAHANLDDADNDEDATTVPLDAAGDTFDEPLGTVTARRVVYGLSTQASVKALNAPHGYAPTLVVEGSTYTAARRPADTAGYQAIDAGYQVNPRTNLPWTTDEIDDSDTQVGGEAQV